MEKRQSNIELLRILLMFMIVMFHFQQKITTTEPFESKLILRTIGITGGALGVNCFVMIYAWFNESDLKKNIHKAIKLGIITSEYIFFMGMIGIALNPAAGVKVILEGLFQPLWLYRYWYVTAFIALMLISPLIDRFINTLSKSEFRNVCIFFMILLCVSSFSGREVNYIKDIWLMISIYYLTKYVKKYELSNLVNKFVFISIICILIVIVFNGIHSFLPQKIGVVIEKTLGYAGRYSVLLIFASLGIFLFFFSLNIQYSKFINNIASLTFGVYLFHENPIFNVGEKVYNLNPFLKWYMRIIYSLLAVFLIFVGGLLFEFLRKKLLNKAENALIEKNISFANFISSPK